MADPTAVTPARSHTGEELTRLWDEVLACADPERGAELLLDHPRAAELIPELPAQDLYGLIQRAGRDELPELVALASPEQLRTFLDLDAWRHDELDLGAALPWLRALAAGGCEDLAARVEELDLELQALLLLGVLRITPLEEDQDPPTGDQLLWIAPDRTLALEVPDPEARDVAELLLRVKEEVLGPFGLARLLHSLVWELPSPLLEDARRWRRGRLEDLGFVPEEEARGLYYPLPRTSAPRATGPSTRQPDTPLPRWLARQTTGELLAAGLAEVEPATRSRVEQDLVHLANALLVAEQIDPGDADAVAQRLRRGRGYLEVALELSGATQPAEAAALLARQPVQHLFRVTATALHDLHTRARRLGTLHGRLPLGAASWLAALSSLPPSLPAPQELRRVAQLREAEAELELLEGQAVLVHQLEQQLVEPVGEPAAVVALFGTALAARMLDQPLRPLSPAEALAWLRLAFRDGQLTPAAQDAAALLLAELLPSPELAGRLAARLGQHLTEELGSLAPDAALDPRFVGGLLLAATPALPADP
ncbi:MAG: DUF6178 family protein [Myxococcota bacterium]|jgi:hypothetical protein|nr:DUF6178 family protein [Myxococcota bacterium]